MNLPKKIDLYWWNGYLGIKNTARRLLTGQPGLIRNFGDRLSPIIVSLLADKPVKHTTNGSGKLLALGSVFYALNDHDLVWGSGLLEATHIKFALKKPGVTYSAVRGPETRNLLIQYGIDCPEVYGDPAQLLPQLLKNDLPKKFRTGIVPHFSQYAYFNSLLQKFIC